MKQWRYWHIVVLLSVFAYRILVHGPLLTLAMHNVCMGQLLNKETNWSQLVFKTRKRNTDHTPAAHEAGLAPASSGREFCERLFLPAFTTVFHPPFMARFIRHNWPVTLAPPISPGKVFLLCRCLRR